MRHTQLIHYTLYQTGWFFSAVVRRVTPERGANYVPMLENWKSVETR